MGITVNLTAPGGVVRDVRAGEASGPAPARAVDYEEFVSTRGPALYRLAHLLAGHTAGAERLLQVALVRLALD